MTSPRVFISYSHDSDAHLARVLELAQTLRKHGVDAWLDRFERGAPNVGWSRWMEIQVESASIVLVVCTETYIARFNGQAPRGVGLGATYEGAIIRRQMLEGGGHNEKFRAVQFGMLETAHVPIVLRDYCHVLPDDYRNLHAFLTGQDLVKPEPVGPVQASAELTYPSTTTFAPVPSGFSVGVEAAPILPPPPPQPQPPPIVRTVALGVLVTTCVWCMATNCGHLSAIVVALGAMGSAAIISEHVR